MVTLSVACTARAKDLYTAGYSHSYTTDDITLNTSTLDYISNRREEFWPYQEDASSSVDWGIRVRRYDGAASGIDFTGLKAEGTLGWRYSPGTYFSADLGSHRLKVPSRSKDSERFTYKVAALMAVTSHVKLNLHAASDYVYQDFLQPAGVTQLLHGKQLRGRLEWQPAGKFRFNVGETAWRLSDDNRSRDYEANILYGISPDWPWIWVGLNYEHLAYDRTMPDYWSPTKFYSYGLVLDSSFPITDNLTGNLSGNLSRIKEEDFALGNGDFAYVGLDYKLTKNHTVRIGVSRRRSIQNNSTWEQKTAWISFNGSF